jgi:5-methylcytosine-specific restriction endonuclease McrA
MPGVLLLDVTYRALHVLDTRRAVILVLAGKAEVVETDPDGVPIRSARLEIAVPAVVRLLRAVKLIHRTPTLTRRALIARDGGVCQFVGCHRAGTTIEHVLPRSRGGSHVWENVVAACERCNHAKGDRTLQEARMVLRRDPFVPRRSVALVVAAGGRAPESWTPYLAAV